MLVAGCATAGDPPEFRSGQVWRLREAGFGNALVTIGLVERRRDQMIVHVSISGLPAPPSNSSLFEALRRETENTDPSSQPLHFIAAGLADSSGRWSLLTVDLSFSSDGTSSSMAVPHVAVYESELRRAVSRPEPSGPPLHSMFEDEMRLRRDGERRWPTLNDEELTLPFSERIMSAIDGAAALASDEVMASRMGPPPPASVELGESAIEDRQLDARCREIVAPGPLDPRLVSNLLEHGFSREEIPEIDVTLSNITVTSSERWGHIWRADTHDNLSPPESGWARSVCWRNSADEQPAVTSYPEPFIGSLIR